MANLIIIVGLSASGKKTLIKTRFSDRHPMPNILAMNGGDVGPRVISHIIEASKRHDKLVTSDVEFCRQEKLYELCYELSRKGIKIQVFYFANNPDNCKRNSAKGVKEGKRPKADDALIDELSKVYNPPDGTFYQDVIDYALGHAMGPS